MRMRRAKRRPTTKKTRARKNTSASEALKDCAISYFLRGGYSCYTELSCLPWGKLRPDLIAVNLRGHIIAAEVKSSWADYTSDKKWYKYAEYCNRLFLVVSKALYESHIVHERTFLKEIGAGVLVLDNVSGWAYSALSAPIRTLPAYISMSIITRMAWRGGVSKRVRTRKRNFINDPA